MTTDLLIVNGRLQRKNTKLRQQRDHWQAEYKKLRQVLDAFPLYERRYQSLTAWKSELAEIRATQQRVKEQALLIERLTKELANNGN